MVQEVKIATDDGVEYSAELDILPRTGDRIVVEVGGAGTGIELSYQVNEVDIHLSGPMILRVSSIHLTVSKSA